MDNQQLLISFTHPSILLHMGIVSMSIVFNVSTYSVLVEKVGRCDIDTVEGTKLL